MLYQPVAERLYTKAQFERSELLWAVALTVGWLAFAWKLVTR